MTEDVSRPTILYAEDHEVVRLAVREMLESEGWRVDACADGRAALVKLEGGGHYGLLIFDYELPCVDGLELTRRARGLSQRRGTPIIVLSASEVEREARRAGADAFVKKPEGMRDLAGTVARLLAVAGED